VYKGTLEDGSVVAIKKMKVSGPDTRVVHHSLSATGRKGEEGGVRAQSCVQRDPGGRQMDEEHPKKDEHTHILTDTVLLLK